MYKSVQTKSAVYFTVTKVKNIYGKYVKNISRKRRIKTEKMKMNIFRYF